MREFRSGQDKFRHGFDWTVCGESRGLRYKVAVVSRLISNGMTWMLPIMWAACVYNIVYHCQPSGEEIYIVRIIIFNGILLYD